MLIDVIEPASPDRVRMNWFRAEWQVDRMGTQAWKAANDMDLMTVLKLDEAAWRYINQFDSEINRMRLRMLYEKAAGMPKPEDWNLTPIERRRKAAVIRADERFAQANSDPLNDSWYEESNDD